MATPPANPLVHLELRTANLSRACVFYTRLFDWRADTVRAGRNSYLALGLSREVQGGVVEFENSRSAWLPYVEVADIEQATDRGLTLGAHALLEPREGPAGWRSILSVPDGAEIALWQPKR